jgi:hypothetical protein
MSVDFACFLRTYARVAIAGGPRTGKTTLAATVKDRPVVHTDDFIVGHEWSEVPALASKWHARCARAWPWTPCFGWPRRTCTSRPGRRPWPRACAPCSTSGGPRAAPPWWSSGVGGSRGLGGMKPDTVKGRPAYTRHTDAALRNVPVEWVATCRLRAGHQVAPSMRAVVGVVAEVMDRTGVFGPPLVAVRETFEVIVGVLRLEAAQRIGLAEVPVCFVSRPPPVGVRGLGMARAT